MDDYRLRAEWRVWQILHEMMAHVSGQSQIMDTQAYLAFCEKAGEVFKAMAERTLTFELTEELNLLGEHIHRDDP